MWNSVDPRRTLFDRAVLWLVKNRVLLPGVTVLARAVAEVRSGEFAFIHAVVDEPIPASLRGGLLELLVVPDGEVFSTLETWRTPPTDRSGMAQRRALERAEKIKALGAGEVDVSRVPPIKLAELARYGMASKAPTLRDLAHPRCTATLLATVRHLETASVDIPHRRRLRRHHHRRLHTDVANPRRAGPRTSGDSRPQKGTNHPTLEVAGWRMRVLML